MSGGFSEQAIHFWEAFFVLACDGYAERAMLFPQAIEGVDLTLYHAEAISPEGQKMEGTS